MTAYDPALIERLVAEAREDDAKMTRAPWGLRDGDLMASDPGQDLHYKTNSVVSRPDYGCNLPAISRTRNNLSAMADQLETAKREVDATRISVVDSERKRIATETALVEIEAERDALRAEVERMRSLMAEHGFVRGDGNA